MIGTTRRDPNIVGATVNESKLDWLGRHADFDYATYRGTEYAVARYPGDPENYSRQRGEIFVMRIRHEVIDGSDFENHQIHRGTAVPSGTYAALQAKAEARARRPDPPMLLVDALAVIPALAAKQELRVVGSWNAHLIRRDARPALRGARAIIEYLSGKGIRLEATADGSGVLVRAKSGRLDSAAREVIRATARLLAGELTSNPVLCELCNGPDRQPAITLAEVDVAVCERHLAEQPR